MIKDKDTRSKWRFTSFLWRPSDAQQIHNLVIFEGPWVDRARSRSKLSKK